MQDLFQKFDVYKPNFVPIKLKKQDLDLLIFF